MRYIFVPGFVRSASDNDWHFIDAENLARLYGVPRSKCIDATQNGYCRQDGDVMLRPRQDGNYTIPEGVSDGR